MSDNQSEFDKLWREAIESHIAGLSDADFQSLSARVRPPAEPLDPVSKARAEAEQRQSARRAKAQQLSDMAAQSDERARGRINLAPTMADRAAAEAEGQAAAAEPQQPQGFTQNRAQGQSGGQPPPANYTPQQKAEQLKGLQQR